MARKKKPVPADPTTLAASTEPMVVKPATADTPTTAEPLATAPPTNWIPSRKWIARTIIAVGGLMTMWATTGSWDVEETVGLISLVSAAGVSYFLPNTVEDVTPS